MLGRVLTTCIFSISRKYLPTRGRGEPRHEGLGGCEGGEEERDPGSDRGQDLPEEEHRDADLEFA